MIADATAAYTDAQLRAAWRSCRLRCWPDTFEATMADPMRERLVRLHAWHMAHPKPRRSQPTPAPRPIAAPAVPAPEHFSLTPPPGYVDRKRAAAGDRDD